MLMRLRPIEASRVCLAILGLSLTLVLGDTAAARQASQRRGGGRPTAKWLGQDAHDVVGPRSQPGPSDVQDLHIQLNGLGAAEIDSIVVRGEGGDEWRYNGPYGPWRAELEREAGQPRADLYLEPTRVEKGRGFTIGITYKDGSSTEIILSGGKADPNLRMPGAALAAKWLGNDGSDWAGPGPGVGPDGLQDASIALERLSRDIEIRRIAIKARDGTIWETGVNPRANHAAWLVRERDNPTRARLFFQPDRKRAKERLELLVEYANDKSDRAVVSDATMDPNKAVAAAKPPSLRNVEIKAVWQGQEKLDPETRGYVAVKLDGLPGQAVAGAALSNATGASWLYRGDGGSLEVASYPRPLVWRPGPTQGETTILFPPVRDEQGSRLDLRIQLRDGSTGLTSLEGGPADLALLSPPVGTNTRKAKPGDDLQALAESGGIVDLAAGTYDLTHPLILNHAIHLRGEPGTILRFSQPADAPAWTTAIKLHAGNTTLEGFQVRFAGPVKWDRDVSYGPALIGTTDNRDPARSDPRAGLVFRNLDLETPPPATDWEEAPRAFRLISAASGSISDSTIRGGCIEIAAGPWSIERNTHLGTPPGTFAFSVVSAHGPNDLLVAENTTRAAGSSGKTWRFLVLTGGGSGITVRDNTIHGIGPRDDDGRVENAPEIILTESYRLRFEGLPSALSADRRLLTIPDLQGDAGEPGDTVAILTGPSAGTYRRVSQRIDRRTFLLDAPLPESKVRPIVSIGAGGFVNTLFQRNTIDGRGSKQAAGFVLAGQHFGTKLENNTILGCGEAIRVVSCPTEFPGPWGWSHMPMFGVDIRDNKLQGPLRGLTIAVEHGKPIATNRGRLYYSGWLRDNTIELDPARNAKPMFVVGDPSGIDPNELVVTLGGNTLTGSPKPYDPVRLEAGKTYPAQTRQR